MIPWAKGIQVGPYMLLAPIGAGGMGEVWKAEDTRLARFVAIKRLKGQPGGRFRQEACAIAALNHPNICQVYDVGPDYLVLEYIEGQDLPCPLPAEEAVRVALEIVSGIEAAHAKGILHRDLKPGNIMLTRSRSVKLLDFGLAKLMTSTDENDTRTAEGRIIGTFAYMSPEQAQGKTLDERSDVFSFGTVLYELLSGTRAFGHGSAAQVLASILHDDPLPLQAPAALEGVVRRCLAKRADDRFQHISSVRIALERISIEPTEIQPSIAVLPFTTMSANKEDDYFSDGLAEEVINALAHIPGLNVTARTSSFAFRGKAEDIRRIAEMLDVRTILEGSVRRAGTRVRVTVQLISAANGYHLWSERYDREMADVFAIQDEIAQAVALSLKVKLSPGTLSVRQHVPDIAAYELFLKGRHFLRKGTSESFAHAQGCLQQAIALDPNFAQAHAELSWCYRLLASLSDTPTREALVQSRAAAYEALKIDPSLAEAHAELAAAAIFLDYDWAAAGHHFQLAMAQEPIPPNVSHLYGFFYLFPLGRSGEAIKELERALKEDPLNLECRTQLGVLFWGAGRNDEAAREFQKALEVDENFWLALFVQAIWNALEGNVESGLALAERAHTVAPQNPCSIGALAGLLCRAEEIDRAERLIRELGDPSAFGVPLALNVFHLIRLEFDKAADWLEKAIEQRDPNAIPASSDPDRKYYVANGRWPALARLLRLPEPIGG